MSDKYNIRVDVNTLYLPDQSSPSHHNYVFAYAITITNQGTVGAQLITRRWVITDANDQSQHVSGNGVVGEQPHLSPGASFEYTSGTHIETPVGTMHGSYQMVADDGIEFEAEIAPFVLSATDVLH